MTISFERINSELILCYTPSLGIDELSRRLSDGETISIKRTFFVNSSLIRKSQEDMYEDALYFCIGKIEKSYTCINSEVIGTNHRFFFSNDITLKQEMFVAYRNISILRKLDDVISKDFYVGGDWEAIGGMPLDAFQELIHSFPKTTELDKYAHSRIASRIKEYFPESDKYEVIYEHI